MFVDCEMQLCVFTSKRSCLTMVNIGTSSGKQFCCELQQNELTPCQKTPSILISGAADLACRITWCWVDLSAWRKLNDMITSKGLYEHEL